MADKPSRGVVLYTVMGWSDSSARPKPASIPSLLGPPVVSWPSLTPLLRIAESEGARIIREFAEMVDANEALGGEDRSQAKRVFPSLAERFMGMKAAIITDNSNLKSFGDSLGLKVLQWNELCNNTRSLSESPLFASVLLKLLGFQDGKTLDTDFYDLVFVHFEAGKNTNNPKDLELLDHLLGDLLHLAQPKTDIRSCLHMSVIMSYGSTLGDEDLELSFSDAKSKSDNELSSLIPRQSYMMKAGKPRENIRQHCPMLLAQYQSAVSRVDMVESFYFRDFVEKCGNLAIPADRFLHEVAFKLWKAPKYGA